MPAAAGHASDEHQPSGFFVLRTPLLAFNEFCAWSDGLRGTHADRHELQGALGADRALLTQRLRANWEQRPEVREAVFLASPELDNALEQSSIADGAARAVRSLVAYFARMTARATPFGLFAGCSVGTLEQHTQLELPALNKYKRHTRLDMDFLSALVTALEGDPVVRQTLRYEPNTSLYKAGGRLHYAESRLSQTGRSYHLVALEQTEELTATLQRANGGACLSELAAALVNDDISETDARDFVDELVANQVLVSDLGPPVTGDEAIHGLIAGLGTQSETQAVAACLEQVRDDLEHLDAAGLRGNPPTRYAEVRSALDSLPTTPDPARLFQVDMVKPAVQLSLGTAVVAELSRGLKILHRIARTDDRRDTMHSFRERFVARYEEAEIPLVEVLDEEIGIGFGTLQEPGGEPLLQGLELPPPTPAPGTWRAQDTWLLRRLTQALERGDQEIALSTADLDAIAAAEPPPPLPDALGIFARLAASSAEAVDRGDFRLWIKSVGGPSGARLLGRFCHADPLLNRSVQDHLQAEEAHRPDAVYAEVVHLPEGRLGNILSRPMLRAYEIPYLGRSGAACDHQIPVADLRVSVRQGRVILRSARLGREVVPRLSTAHNVTQRSLGVYRFLCALQHQRITAGLVWSWGPLSNAPFLPRVVSGRLVLERACWNLASAELKRLQEAHGADQFAAVQEWRLVRRLPHYVTLVDADNELLIDLDNVLSVDAFLHRIKGLDAARLVELFPPPDELCVVGPEGCFVNELVVPFVRANAPASEPQRPAPAAVNGVPRRFPPGSAWTYVKLYTGPAVADRLLVEAIRPVVDTALASGASDGWFFIRYADPAHHLRLRFHGNPRRMAAELLPELGAAFAPLVEDGRIASWQLDTYVREVERYGGDEGILVAERFFGADSECVLSILESVAGDDSLSWRWKLALCGVDLLLDALGLPLEQKCEWARRRRDAFAREFRVDSRLRQQLGDKYRSERHALDDLLRLARSPEATRYPALRALHHRSNGILAAADQLESLDRAGRLGVTIQDLASSYAHMHVNRLLRSAHRFQELAVYELLDRTYRSQQARAGGE